MGIQEPQSCACVSRGSSQLLFQPTAAQWAAACTGECSIFCTEMTSVMPTLPLPWNTSKSCIYLKHAMRSCNKNMILYTTTGHFICETRPEDYTVFTKLTLSKYADKASQRWGTVVCLHGLGCFSDFSDNLLLQLTYWLCNLMCFFPP